MLLHDQLTNLASSVKDASSLQAVLGALGVTAITTGASIYGKSKIRGAGTVFLGLVLIIAPFILPYPKLITTIGNPPDTLLGSWQTFDSNFYGIRFVVASDEHPELIDTPMVVNSCPRTVSNCAANQYNIVGTYNKSTGKLRFTRRSSDTGEPNAEYVITFEENDFGKGFATQPNATPISVFVYRVYN